MINIYFTTVIVEVRLTKLHVSFRNQHVDGRQSKYWAEFDRVVSVFKMAEDSDLEVVENEVDIDYTQIFEGEDVS